MFLSSLYVLIALINPSVPIEIRSSRLNKFVSYSSDSIEGYAFISLLNLFNTDMVIKKCKNWVNI